MKNPPVAIAGIITAPVFTYALKSPAAKNAKANAPPNSRSPAILDLSRKTAGANGFRSMRGDKPVDRCDEKQGFHDELVNVHRKVLAEVRPVKTLQAMSMNAQRFNARCVGVAFSFM
jgi:hypothetical protein